MGQKFLLLLTSAMMFISRKTCAEDQEISPLNLSPWELHVLSDLYIELSLLRCPSINRSAARSLKRFISHQLSNIENESEMMNAEFYTVYQNLVNCLEHLDTGAHSTSSNNVSPNTTTPNTDKKSSELEYPWETDMEVPNYLDLSSTTELNLLRYETEASKDQSTLSAFWDLLQRIFIDRNIFAVRKKAKRDIQEEKLQAEREEQKKRTQLARTDFYTMVDMFSRIVKNACPVKFKPSQVFTGFSIKEIISTVAVDPSSMVGAVDYFFVKAGLWQQVRNCLIDSSKLSTDNSIQAKPS